MSRLQKPLRAQKQYDEDVSADESHSQSAASASDRSEDGMEEDSTPSEEDLNPDDDDDNNTDNSQDDSASDTHLQTSLRTISFGALASAQDSLTKPRSHKSSLPDPSSRTDGAKVSALRARLAELKFLKASRNNTTTSTTSSSSHLSALDRYNPISSSSNPSSSRSSKHAPTEQTSKRQVPRLRPIVADLSQNPTHLRDPRFTPSTLAPAESEKLRRNYSFLDTYRSSELSTLKSALSDLKSVARKRKSKSLTAGEETEKERLTRTINALENRGKAEAKKEKERDIVRGHRREEKEKVKAGKTPFFLKRSEVKKQALTERWEGMKGRDREKALKRRRKKMSERERRAMPGERRGRDG